MRAKVDAFSSLRSLFPLFPTLFSSSTPSILKTLTLKACLCSSTSTSTSTTSNKDKNLQQQVEREPKNSSADVFQKCGCSDDEISKIFLRQPSLLKADPTILESKLGLLRGLGLTGSDLVKIINCRPRLLACRIGRGLDERINFLQTLFGSKEMLLKAIIRNPSLLNYDLQNGIKPCVALYQGMGISKEELVPMLISRPTLVPRSSLNQDKVDYIRRTGLSKDSKMYKYVVSLIAISRLETIREKVANLEKFGFSGDEVMGLFGRSPLVLTLSIDKVQRNMTFIIGTVKLPATVILRYPFLLYYNLETALKLRLLLAKRIRAMGLLPQIKGPAMLRALRMAEPRFLKAFVTCHSKDVTKELMEFYEKIKGIKRLAETSKRSVHRGFPF